MNSMFLLLVILFNLTHYLEANRSSGNSSSGHHHNVWKRKAQQSGYLGYDEDSEALKGLKKTATPRSAENGGFTGQVLLVGGGSVRAGLYYVEPIEGNIKTEAIDVRNVGQSGADVVRTRPNLNLAPFPINYGPVGTFIDNTVLVCGGMNTLTYNTVYRDCYTYNRNSNTWSKFMYSMGTSRTYAAGVQLSPTQWWVTGGSVDSLHVETTYSTEVFTVGQGFSKYVDLPVARKSHQMLKVDSSRIVMAGHCATDYYSKGPWMFNVKTATWQKLPEMPPTTRYSPIAGIATLPDGRKELVVVCASIFNAVHVLSLDTLTWRRAADIPHPPYMGLIMVWAASVPYGNSFMVLGGDHDDRIYRYNVKTGLFEELRQKLTMYPRSMFAAIGLPADFLTFYDH